MLTQAVRMKLQELEQSRDAWERRARVLYDHLLTTSPHTRPPIDEVLKMCEFNLKEIENTMLSNDKVSNVRFEDLGNGIILDTETGLEWQAETIGPMKWQEAMGYAKNLELGGHNDWRLPTIEELLTLIDDTKCDPASSFPGMQAEWYWSSISPSVSESWYVNFLGGQLNLAVDKTDGCYARCVRSVALGNQCFDNSDIQKDELKEVGKSEQFEGVSDFLNYQTMVAAKNAARNNWEHASVALELASIRERLAEIKSQSQPLDGLMKDDSVGLRDKLYAAAFYVVVGRLPG